jgi:hypothetical protein
MAKKSSTAGYSTNLKSHLLVKNLEPVLNTHLQTIASSSHILAFIGREKKSNLHGAKHSCVKRSRHFGKKAFERNNVEGRLTALEIFPDRRIRGK